VPKNSDRRNDVRRANKDRRSRLDELRRQQRAAERRKNFLTFGSAIAVAVILIGTVVTLSVVKARANDAKKKVGYVAPISAAERAAGCTGVHNDPVSPAGTHVPNATIDYSKEKYGDTQGGTLALPPTGGKHNPQPLGDTSRFYALKDQPRAERAVHNLEHGYIDVWFDAQVPADQVAQLQGLVNQPSFSRMLAVGWWQGDLPAGKHVVLTSWARTERCDKVDSTVLRAFYTNHLNSSVAPEAGSGPLDGAKYPANDINTTPGAPPATTPTPSASASPSPTSTKK
jgi:hypothetical protein